MKMAKGILKVAALATAGAGCLLVVAMRAGQRELAGAADHRDVRAFGLVSVNPGRELRLNVFSLTFTGRVRRALVAFEVYAPAAAALVRPVVNPDGFCDGHSQVLSSLEAREAGRTTSVVNPNMFISREPTAEVVPFGRPMTLTLSSTLTPPPPAGATAKCERGALRA